MVYVGLLDLDKWIRFEGKGVISGVLPHIQLHGGRTERNRTVIKYLNQDTFFTVFLLKTYTLKLWLVSTVLLGWGLSFYKQLKTLQTRQGMGRHCVLKLRSSKLGNGNLPFQALNLGNATLVSRMPYNAKTGWKPTIQLRTLHNIALRVSASPS